MDGVLLKTVLNAYNESSLCRCEKPVAAGTTIRIILVCNEEDAFGGGFRRAVMRERCQSAVVPTKSQQYPSRIIQLQLVKTSPIGTRLPSIGGNVSLSKFGSSRAARFCGLNGSLAKQRVTGLTVDKA